MIIRHIKKVLHILFCLGAMACNKLGSVPETKEHIPISLTVSADKAKTIVSGAVLPNAYTIYASSYFTSYNAPEANGDYFLSLPFNDNGSGTWTTTPVVYWPLGGKLDMIAVACEKDSLNVSKNVTWHEGNCSDGLEVTLADGDCMRSEILFAAAYGCTVDIGSVPMKFKHAQSWLQFNVTTETEILRIDKIVLENAYTGGLFRVSNNVYMEAGWTYRGHRKADVIVPGTEGLTPSKGKVSTCNMLVPEQDACNVVIYYSVKSSPADDWTTARHSVYRHPAGVNPWFYGEKNVFNIGFSFPEIMLSTSVKLWDDKAEDIRFEDDEDD